MHPIVSFNKPFSLTLGYITNNMPTKALDLYNEIPSKLDSNLYAIVYTACGATCNERSVTLGKQLLSDMSQIFKDDLIVMGSAIHMLLKFGDVEQAELLFLQMKKRDASSYGVMMNGYHLNGLPEKALDLFDAVSSMMNANLYTIMYSACATLSNDRATTLGEQLLEKMPTMFNDNLIVMGSAIHMLMRFGDVKQAERLFSLIKEPDAASYGVMMNGYHLNGLPEKALDLSDQASPVLNANLYAILYNACGATCNERSVTLGKKLLSSMSPIFKDDLIVMGSAIQMLMRFGDVKQAERLFSLIEEPDAATYGVMMHGYNINNEPLKCLKLFEDVKRQKVKLDERMNVSLVSAYSRIGMISMCREAVKQISTEAMNSSRVQNSLIDMWVSVLCTVDVKSTSSFTLFFIRVKQVPLTKPSKHFNRSASLLR
jgi:pentatricopeptide repeat protein